MTGSRVAEAGASTEIVVGIDDSPASDGALRWAAAEAALWEASLTVVYAATPTMATWSAVPMPTGLLDWQRDVGLRILEDAEKTVKELTQGSVAVRTEFHRGSPTTTLVERSRTARMVVDGCRGRGALARAALGSVSTGLVHRAQCSVAVVHHDESSEPAVPTAPVLLGFDGSSASDAATAIAFEEARRRDVELLVVHAWWSAGAFDFPGVVWEDVLPQVDRDIAGRLEQWERRFPGVTVRRVVEPDMPARRLVNYSHTAQLVVVGSHGHGGVASALLGSVSSAVVQAVRIPVVVARPR